MVRIEFNPFDYQPLSGEFLSPLIYKLLNEKDKREDKKEWKEEKEKERREPSNDSPQREKKPWAGKRGGRKGGYRTLPMEGVFHR